MYGPRCWAAMMSASVVAGVLRLGLRLLLLDVREHRTLADVLGVDRYQVFLRQLLARIEQAQRLTHASAIDGVADAASMREARLLDAPFDVLAERLARLVAELVGLPREHHVRDL